MNIKFDHVSLRAKDIDNMKDFLISLLGLEIGVRPEFPFQGYWLYSNGKDLVHIFNEQATFYKKDLIDENIEEEISGKNIVNHICFYSDDYEEVMKRIKDMELDYSINHAPGLPIEQIFINAPENLIVEIQAIPKGLK